MKSTLFQLIWQFDRQEVQMWILFLQSPYFNKHKETIQLAELIQRVDRNDPDFNFSKEEIYKELYPDSKFNDDKIRWLFSNLLRLTESFIAQQRFERDKEEKISQFLLPILKEDFNFIRYPYHFKRALKKTKHDYKSRYKILEEKDDALIYNNDFSKSDLLIQKQEILEKWMLFENLKNACDLLNRSQFVRLKFDQDGFDAMVEQVSNNPDKYKDDYLILIFKGVYYSMSQPDDQKNFESLFQLVRDYQSQIERKMLRNIYYYLLNYVFRKINAGSTDHLETALLIFEEMLSKKLLHQGKYFPENMFKNIIAIALRMKRTDWVRDFIQSYANQLPEEVAENAFHYNMANLLYHENKMDAAMLELINVVYTNINYNLDSKALLLRIYYEADEDAAFDAHFNAFKVYLTRNKLLASKKHKRYYNFFRFANRLQKVRLQLPYQKVEKTENSLRSIKNQLDKAKEVVNLSWLKQQTAELESEPMG